jgi:hypothetical protein
VNLRASDAPVGSKVYQNTTIYHRHSTNNTFGGFEEVGGGWICNSIATIHLEWSFRAWKSPPPLSSFAAIAGLQNKYNNQQLCQLIQIELN